MIFKVLFCREKRNAYDGELHIVHEIWTKTKSQRFFNDFLCNPFKSRSQSSPCSWIGQCFHKLIIRHSILTSQKKNQSIGFTLVRSLEGVSREGLGLEEAICVCVFCRVSLRCACTCGFGLLTRGKPSTLFFYSTVQQVRELHMLLKESEWVTIMMMFLVLDVILHMWCLPLWAWILRIFGLLWTSFLPLPFLSHSSVLFSKFFFQLRYALGLIWFCLILIVEITCWASTRPGRRLAGAPSDLGFLSSILFVGILF